MERVILFELSAHEVNAFLTDLAVEAAVSASTQTQALSALLFLDDVVLNRPLPHLDLVRAAKVRRSPVVLSREEVTVVLRQLRGVPWLVVTMLYGTGMRLLECLRLPIKDLDFERNAVTIYEAKGSRDRRTMLPEIVKGAAAASFESGACSARGRPGVWLWGGSSSGGFSTEVSRGGARVEMAIHISGLGAKR